MNAAAAIEGRIQRCNLSAACLLPTGGANPGGQMIVSWRWYASAILAGLAAAAVVWFSPIGPVWRSPPKAGRLEGFSPDGQILITTNVVPHWGYSDPNPELCRWDAATGRLLGRVKLACPELEVVKGVRPSGD